MHDDTRDTTVIINNIKQNKELRGWLVMLDSRGKALKSYELNKSIISIGRDPDNDIVIADKTVSRAHCTIEIENQKNLIIEKNSVNGIILDNYPIVRSILDDGMTIQLGKINFLVKLL